MTTRGSPVTAEPAAGGTLVSPRLNIHSNIHRYWVTAVVTFAFAGWALGTPWRAGLGWVIAGSVVVWRTALVRLAEIDGGQLLVRNVLTTRRLAPEAIDRLAVADYNLDTRGHSRIVEVHRKPAGRRFALKRIQCAATMTCSADRAAATSQALAVWADAHGIRCDVDPHQLVSGLSGLAPLPPESRCDALLTAGARRLQRELRHAPGQHRNPAPEPRPNPIGSADPADLVAAMTMAYAQVDAEARRIATRGGIDEPDLHRLVLRARSARLVHRSATAAIEEVVALHRMVSRGELVPTRSQARRYVELVDDELIALRLPPRG